MCRTRETLSPTPVSDDCRADEAQAEQGERRRFRNRGCLLSKRDHAKTSRVQLALVRGDLHLDVSRVDTSETKDLANNWGGDGRGWSEGPREADGESYRTKIRRRHEVHSGGRLPHVVQFISSFFASASARHAAPTPKTGRQRRPVSVAMQ